MTVGSFDYLANYQFVTYELRSAELLRFVFVI
jgi:hypothetical protein